MSFPTYQIYIQVLYVYRKYHAYHSFSRFSSWLLLLLVFVFSFKCWMYLYSLETDYNLHVTFFFYLIRDYSTQSFTSNGDFSYFGNNILRGCIVTSPVGNTGISALFCYLVKILVRRNLSVKYSFCWSYVSFSVAIE